MNVKYFESGHLTSNANGSIVVGTFTQMKSCWNVDRIYFSHECLPTGNNAFAAHETYFLPSLISSSRCCWLVTYRYRGTFKTKRTSSFIHIFVLLAGPSGRRAVVSQASSLSRPTQYLAGWLRFHEILKLEMLTMRRISKVPGIYFPVDVVRSCQKEIQWVFLRFAPKKCTSVRTYKPKVFTFRFLYFFIWHLIIRIDLFLIFLVFLYSFSKQSNAWHIFFREYGKETPKSRY